MKDKRPSLTHSIDVNVFSNFYWLKSELIAFCCQHDLGSHGSKIELTERIKNFLISGIKTSARLPKPNKLRDSLSPLTRNTRVVNYKNDAATKTFFVQQIGLRFHFNAYLRQHMDKKNITPDLTYGDLVEGWLREESSPAVKTIDKQFEYNTFIRDFFANEKGKSLAEAIKAWKIIKSKPGRNTYEDYKNFKMESL